MKDNVKTESGLSLMSRLFTRPCISKCLGPTLRPLQHQFSWLNILGDCHDQINVLTSYLSHLICKITLPKQYKSVDIGKPQHGKPFKSGLS